MLQRFHTNTQNAAKAVYVVQPTSLQPFKGHRKYMRENQGYRSAIAGHALEYDHSNITTANLKLVKQINDERKLDAYESYYIQKDGNAINLDNGNIESSLIPYIINASNRTFTQKSHNRVITDHR